ncbi:VapE domain-containing protein [Roseibium album]|uniref:VapE domain-containing protein n=1 Tax=Roseibium album TaxID=311410 RepID=UPI0024933DCC|nr:VapE domain-containing protein [Roseibium album]
MPSNKRSEPQVTSNTGCNGSQQFDKALAARLTAAIFGTKDANGKTVPHPIAEEALFCVASFGKKNRDFWVNLKPNEKGLRTKIINNFLEAFEAEPTAAICGTPSVYIPAEDGKRQQRRTSDIHAVFAIVAEIDDDPETSTLRVERAMGTPTAVVRSGGIWLPPSATDQGEVVDLSKAVWKRHLWFKLEQPATGDDVALAVWLQKLVTRLAAGTSGDASFTSVHPIRWPGTLHAKDRSSPPRQVGIAELNADKSISLKPAIAVVERAIVEAGLRFPTNRPASLPPLHPQNAKRQTGKTEAASGGVGHCAAREDMFAVHADSVAIQMQSEKAQCDAILTGGEGTFHASTASYSQTLANRGLSAEAIREKMKALAKKSRTMKERPQRVADWLDRELDGLVTSAVEKAETLFKRKAAEAHVRFEAAIDNPLYEIIQQAEECVGNGITAERSADWYAGTTASQTPLREPGNYIQALLMLGFKPLWDARGSRPVLVSEQGHLRPIQDEDLSDLTLRMSVAYPSLKPTPQKIKEALITASRGNVVDQFKDFLTSLPPWDGVERAGRLLTHYFSADLTDWLHGDDALENEQQKKAAAQYLVDVSWAFLLSIVERTLRPGCKADAMLILAGTQGALKSSGLRALVDVGEGLFTELNLSAKLTSKDLIEATRRAVLVEDDELSMSRKADAEALKAMLSRQSDEARAAYGHFVEAVPRRFVMAGTTNRDGFLSDHSGSRRFWPVKVGDGCQVDVEGIVEDREQIWAEVLEKRQAAIDNGEPLKWWLEGLSADFAASVGETVTYDPTEALQERINDLLNKPDSKMFLDTRFGDERILLSRLDAALQGVSDVSFARAPTGRSAHELKVALNQLGFTQRRNLIWGGKKQTRVYVRGFRNQSRHCDAG